MKAASNRSLILATLLAIVGTSLFAPPGRAATNDWKSGVAKVKITPAKSMWMSGYGGRDHAAEGTLTDLWAKSLVLEDGAGRRCVFVTLDLVGIGRDMVPTIRKRLKELHNLDAAQVALLCSHTHTGPLVGDNLRAMFVLDDAQQQLIDEYSVRLQDDVVAAVGQSLEKLAPAELAWGIGRATFAVNRRNNKEAEVPELIKQGLLKGPVDHDVPVLKVSQNGRPSAILFGYACHATVLSFYQWSGDYPGFAQIELEKSHPGTIALFWAGCGADQNPLPRRTVELAQEYGTRLASAVDQLLADSEKLQPIAGPLRTEFREIDLAYDKLPERDEIEKRSQLPDRFQVAWGKRLLKQIDRDGQLSPSYPYPVQSWRLGQELLFVALGGEVVVDYSLRLKQELGPDTTWVAGYANDVMAYIPSLRVLKEGGYEGGGAMLYYGLPTSWSPAVEESIIRAVHEQMQRLRAK